LELLDALDLRRKPFTRMGDTVTEASFLFVAVLNLFYLLTEIMPAEGNDASSLRAAHPEINAREGRRRTCKNRSRWAGGSP
jgi:hypothetical protein